MNTKVKKKWVEALRSRKYKQGIQRLHNLKKNTYCCLGVLCDIYIKSKEGKKNNARWDEYTDTWGDIDYGFVSNCSKEGDFLPQEVGDWAGLDENNPDLYNIDEDGRGVTASMANDDYGKKFHEIAKFVERNL